MAVLVSFVKSSVGPPVILIVTTSDLLSDLIWKRPKKREKKNTKVHSLKVHAKF